MTDPLIMPVKPGAITPGAKRKLEKAGVIVVECENPEEIRLIKPWAELSGSDLLLAAMRALDRQPQTHLREFHTRSVHRANQTRPGNRPPAWKRMRSFPCLKATFSWFFLVS